MIDRLPQLPQIVEDLDITRDRLAEATRVFECATLADRVWIGVCCLAAKEHHAIAPEDSGKMGGRGNKKGVLRRRTPLEPTAELTHPQGYLAWLKLALPWLAQPTAYKYMDAARGCGLTAWATEDETRTAVASRLQAYEAEQKQLTLKALADAGREKPANLDDQPPSAANVQLTFDDFLGFRAAATDLLSKRDLMTPAVYNTLTDETRRLLENLTGERWESTGERIDTIITHEA